MKILSLLLICIIIPVTALAVSSRLSEKLLYAIKEKDSGNVVRVINEIKQNGNYDPVYQTLIALWNKDKSSIGKIDWGFLNDDFIKINIADALIQAKKMALLR